MESAPVPIPLFGTYFVVRMGGLCWLGQEMRTAHAQALKFIKLKSKFHNEAQISIYVCGF